MKGDVEILIVVPRSPSASAAAASRMSSQFSRPLHASRPLRRSLLRCHLRLHREAQRTVRDALVECPIRLGFAGLLPQLRQVVTGMESSAPLGRTLPKVKEAVKLRSETWPAVLTRILTRGGPKLEIVRSDLHRQVSSHTSLGPTGAIY